MRVFVFNNSFQPDKAINSVYYIISISSLGMFTSRGENFNIPSVFTQNRRKHILTDIVIYIRAFYFQVFNTVYNAKPLVTPIFYKVEPRYKYPHSLVPLVLIGLATWKEERREISHLYFRGCFDLSRIINQGLCSWIKFWF